MHELSSKAGANLFDLYVAIIVAVGILAVVFYSPCQIDGKVSVVIIAVISTEDASED